MTETQHRYFPLTDKEMFEREQLIKKILSNGEVFNEVAAAFIEAVRNPERPEIDPAREYFLDFGVEYLKSKKSSVTRKNRGERWTINDD